MSKGASSRAHWEARCQWNKGEIGPSSRIKSHIGRPCMAPHSQVVSRHVVHVAVLEPASEGALSQAQQRSTAAPSSNREFSNGANSRGAGRTPRERQQAEGRSTSYGAAREEDGERQARAGAQRSQGYIRAGNGVQPSGQEPGVLNELWNAGSVEQVAALLVEHEEALSLTSLTLALKVLITLEEEKPASSPALPSLLERIVHLSSRFSSSPDIREHTRLVNRLESLGFKTNDFTAMESLIKPINQLAEMLELNKPIIVRLGKLWSGKTVPPRWFTNYSVARRIRGLGVWKTYATVIEETKQRKAEESDLVQQIFKSTTVDELAALSDDIVKRPFVTRGRLLVRTHQMLAKLMGNRAIERNQNGASMSDQVEEWTQVAPGVVTAPIRAMLTVWSEQLPLVLAQHRRETFEISMGPVLWAWARLGWWPKQEVLDEVLEFYAKECQRNIGLAGWKLSGCYYSAQGLTGIAHLPSPSLESVNTALDHVHDNTCRVVTMVMGHALSSMMGACVHLNITRSAAWWKPLLLLHLERSLYMYRTEQMEHFSGLLQKLFSQWPQEWQKDLPKTKQLWEGKLSCAEIHAPFKVIPVVQRSLTAAATLQGVIDIVEPHWGSGHHEYAVLAVRQISKIVSDKSSDISEADLASIMPYYNKYLQYVADHVDYCFPHLVSWVTGAVSSLEAARPAIFKPSVSVLAGPVATFFAKHAFEFNEREYTTVLMFLQKAGYQWNDPTQVKQVTSAFLAWMGDSKEQRARFCIPVLAAMGAKLDVSNQERLLKKIKEKDWYWTGFHSSMLQLCPEPRPSWEPALVTFFHYLWERAEGSARGEVLGKIREAVSLEAVLQLLDEHASDMHPEYQAAAFRRIGLLYSIRSAKLTAGDSASDPSTSDQTAESDSTLEELSQATASTPALNDSARAAIQKLAHALLDPNQPGLAESVLGDSEMLRNVMNCCAHLGVQEALGAELAQQLGDPVDLLCSSFMKVLQTPSVLRGPSICECLWSLAALGYTPDEKASRMLITAFLDRLPQCEEWHARSGLRSLVTLNTHLNKDAATKLLSILASRQIPVRGSIFFSLKKLCPADTPGLEVSTPASPPPPPHETTPEALLLAIKRAGNLSVAQRLYSQHQDTLTQQQQALLLRKIVQLQSRSARAAQQGKVQRAPPASIHATILTLTTAIHARSDSFDLDTLQQFSYAIARMDPTLANEALTTAGTNVGALLPCLQGLFFAYVMDMAPNTFAEMVWSLGRLGYAPDNSGLMVLGERLLTLLPGLAIVQLRMLLSTFVGFNARTAPQVIEQLLRHVHEQHLDAETETLRDVMQSLESMCTEIVPDWYQKYPLCGQYWGRTRSVWSATIAQANLGNLQALLQSQPPDLTPSDFVFVLSRLAELAPPFDINQEADEAPTAGDRQDWPDLGPILLDAAMQRLGENVSAYRGWQVTRILQTAARLDMRPEAAWLDAFLDQAMKEVDSLSSNTISGIIDALGRIGYFAGEVRLSALLSQLRIDATTSGRPLRAPSAVAALAGAARVYYTPDSEWLAWFLDHSQNLLKACSPSQLVELVSALSRVNSRPGEQWSRALMSAVETVYPRLKPRDKAKMVRGLEKLGCALPQDAGVAAMQ